MSNIKESLCYAMRHLYKNSFISLRDGNVSFREKNSNIFLITPGGIKKDNISQNQIIDVVLKSKYPYYLPLNNNFLNVSREIGFHSRILKDEQDDCFIVHCHPKNTIAFMGLIENNELNIDIKRRVETIEGNEPPERKPGVIVNDVDSLIDKLKNEANVI